MNREDARVERELMQRDALALASGTGIAVERSMLVPLLCARARVQYDTNDAPVVEYQSVFGDWFVDGQTIIREMMSDHDFEKVFSAPKAVPAKPRERNPFAKGPDFNLTEQMRLLKIDPMTAARLKAVAAEEHSR